MSRRRKTIWLGSVLLALAGGIGGYYWYWQSHAIDRKVCQLVYEAAGYPDTKFEKRLRSMKLDFLMREKPKPRGDYSDCRIRSDIKIIGKAAIPALVSLLTDENAEVRGISAVFLFDVGDERSVEPLIESLRKDKDPTVRQIAAIALGLLRDKRAVEPLINALSELPMETSDFHISFIAGLAALKDKRAINPLIQIMKNHKEYIIREVAAEALGDIGCPDALNALENVMEKDRDEGVRVRSKQAIEKIKSTATQPRQAATSTAPASQPD